MADPPPPGWGPPPPPGWGPPPPAWGPQAPVDPGWGGQPPGGWGGPGWSGGGWAPPPTGGTAATGPLPLAPMGLGEILDGAFKLYRANFKPIALVALAVAGPLSVLGALAVRGVNGGHGLIEVINDPSLADRNNGSAGNATQIVLLLITSMILLLSGPFVAGVVAKAVATTYLGSQISAGEAARATGRMFLPLLAARLLVSLTELGGLLGCCVGAVFVMALWVVVTPAIVVERLGPLQGMRRSYKLCSARYWPVLGTALLSGVITQVLSGIVNGGPSTVAQLIGYRWGFPLLAFGNVANAVLVQPVTAIVATLLYFDLRIRQEGFDLQIMARDLGASGATTT